MAYDEGAAQVLRDALGETDGIAEKRMFGGMAFLLNGNMVCGVHAGGGMFRVGKPAEAEALTVRGARPMTFTGRPMGGMVEVDHDLLADDTRVARLMALALAHARSLPPK